MNTVVIPKTEQEVFDDFWQEMHERGGVGDVANMIGMSFNKMSSDTSGTCDYDYWNIAPPEITKKAQDKIIDKYGGMIQIIEFMGNNADWEEYRGYLEEMEEDVRVRFKK